MILCIINNAEKMQIFFIRARSFIIIYFGKKLLSMNDRFIVTINAFNIIISLNINPSSQICIRLVNYSFLL